MSDTNNIKRIVQACELHTVTVFRGKGAHIQSITDFTDFGEAVDFAKATPADQEWSMSLSLTKTHEYPRYTDNPIDVDVTLNGPGYTAHLYD